MAGKNQSCGLDKKEDQHKMQDMEIKNALSHIKNKLLVMSGKGGVGKSSVAAYLSVSLAKKGYKVGLMDVDLHGPSIPRMLGLKGTIKPGSRKGKAGPVEYLPNLHVISIEPLMGDQNRDTATIWRGPLKIGVIRQFISDIEWMDLDYMIIDSPPGTGDEPLTVAQTIPDAKAIVVTTPQEISLADVRKSLNFCRHVKMQILGLVENMSGLICPHCGKMIEIFGTKGGEMTARAERVKLLARLPFDPRVVQNGDVGSMDFLNNDELEITQAFYKLVDSVVELTEKAEEPEQKKAFVSKGNRQAGKKTIAFPVSGGLFSSHFGESEEFTFVEIEDGKITGTKTIAAPPHEPGVLPGWIHEHGADVVIAGGMGERAQQLLKERGIEVILGISSGSPESLANQYIADSLTPGDNVCNH